MGAAKDVTKAVAFLHPYDFGGQPAIWLMPNTLTASQLGVDADDPEEQAPVNMFSHEAVVLYVVDQGDHYEWVTIEDMRAAGLDHDGLYEIGVANLARMVPKLRIDDRNGVLTLQGSGMFEASMILCTPLWQSEEFLSRYGIMGPIVAIPSRDMMAICVRGDEDGLRRIGRAPDLVWSVAEPELRLCRDLYAMTIDGEWLPYESEHSPVDRPAPSTDAASAATVFTHLIDELPPELRTPANPTASGQVLDPLTPIETVGGKPFSIPSSVFSSLEGIHYELLFASGYRFDTDSGMFVRAFVGEPGAPPDPWNLTAWNTGNRDDLEKPEHERGSRSKRRRFRRV